MSIGSAKEVKVDYYPFLIGHTVIYPVYDFYQQCSNRKWMEGYGMVCSCDEPEKCKAVINYRKSRQSEGVRLLPLRKKK